MENKQETICSMCFKDTKFIAELADGYYLVETSGVYEIMREPCHMGDNIIQWPFKPIPEPSEDLEIHDTWFDAVCDWEFPQFSVEASYVFMLACIKAGYNFDTDGKLSFWLTNWAGKQIEEYEANK